MTRIRAGPSRATTRAPHRSLSIASSSSSARVGAVANALKVATADPRRRGRLSHVPTVLVEDARAVAALVLVDHALPADRDGKPLVQHGLDVVGGGGAGARRVRKGLEHALAHRQHARDLVLQLADVAGPRMLLELFEQARRHGPSVPAELGTERLREERDIARAKAQRGKLHATDREAIVEVVPEPAQLHLFV